MRKGMLLPMMGMALMIFLIAPKGFAQDANPTTAPNQPAQPNQVKTIFSFKDQIGLSDDQETKLKALLYDEQSFVDQSNETLKTMGAELGKLIEDKADMQAIRSKLEDISKVQIDTSCRNIEDSRKVEGILTPDQLAKWKDIQKQFSAPAKS